MVGVFVGLIVGVIGPKSILNRLPPNLSPQSSPFAHFLAAQSHIGFPQPFCAQFPHKPYLVADIKLFDTQHSPPCCKAEYLNLLKYAAVIQLDIEFAIPKDLTIDLLVIASP